MICSCKSDLSWTVELMSIINQKVQIINTFVADIIIRMIGTYTYIYFGDKYKSECIPAER